ncbi:putative PEP-binding protein [Halorussus sp. MSC15.2]|uniref:putative PEP-binding protein n=1 Tax=Halorussus sp. MSC15.2 TaxID=2283638 RepID=UPI0013CFC0FD|nr:putative PEP-binding protein [Halorussus sp. MSC15.2]NEU55759.1 phosphoenolpyruvate--protein phosphotransferase [Halorussus sp. MSC15.2]
MTDLRGVGVGTGAATGKAFWLTRDASDSPDTPDASDTQTAHGTPEDSSRSPDAERERFERARSRTVEELRDEQERAAAAVGKAAEDVLATHETFLYDPAFEERVEEAIEADETAERAVASALEDWIEAFEDTGGKTAARADDLRDLRGRLLRAFPGESERSVRGVPPNAVVLAERLEPSQAVRLAEEGVTAVATVSGSRTSHAAILLRSRGVPAVVGVGEALRTVEGGSRVGVDAAAGRVTLAPGDDDAGSLVQETPSDVRTASGTPLAVTANVGSSREAAVALERGADGVGLFRSEFLAFRSDGVPDADAQTEAYAAALDRFPESRVAVRTFDFGGDKPLPGTDETGPRGVAGSLANPDRHRDQLRALCRAAARGAGDLTVVLPHVTRVEEVTAVRDHLDAVTDELADEGVAYERPDLGVMVETPAAVELAPELADRVASVSLGTNDLARYVLGTTRDADPEATEPAVIRAIERAVAAATDAGVRVRCCGEATADPDFAALLVGFGVTETSVAPDAVPAVRRRLDGLDADAAAAVAERAAAASTKSEVDSLLNGES